MKNIGVNYGMVQAVTATVARNAAVQLENDINSAYQEMTSLMALSAGDGVEKIREQLAEEQKLAAGMAELYRGLADLVKRASDALEEHDSTKSRTTVAAN